MSYSAPRISIVIPAFNEASDLPSLLDSLKQVRHDECFEIIVVDNGSTDATASVARAVGAKVISIPRSPVGAGRNVGAKAARGELLAFLDADVIATPQWIDEVRALADRKAEADSHITGDIYDIVDDPSWIERHWFGAIYARGAQTYLNGGNLIISRADFARVGGFDEQMISGEDVEFCSRAAAIGISVRPNRTLRVLHKGYPSTAQRFIGREAWHGRSDFVSIQRILASPVAIAAMIFAALHLVLAASLVAQYWTIAMIATGGIALVCLLSAFWKWRGIGWNSRLINSAVFYLYFTGRSVAAWDELISRVWQPEAATRSPADASIHEPRSIKRS
jgi:glycosyltransferase involved in cell wall biosynthesis